MELRNEIEEFNKRVADESWGMQVSFDTPSAIHEKGLELLGQKGDMLLAMCLNNGYYNRDNIYKMLSFSLAFSDRVQIFTTDGPAKHNYFARGYNEADAEKSTRTKKNRLINQCNDGLEKINAKLPEDQQKSISFMVWADIYVDPAYQDTYAATKNLYETSDAFKKDIDETSRQVLMNRIGIESKVDEVLSVGVEYVLEELAFIVSYRNLKPETKPVSDHGNNGFSYMYYEPWLVFENLINGVYDEPKEGIGFILAKITDSK